jgi:hypothetical protein
MGAETLVSEQGMIGKILASRYELRERLGQGGLSTVYKACNLATERDVVVKWVRTASDRERARLMRESRLLSRLSEHTDGVVRYLDFLQDEGELYLVTEYIPGQTLQELQLGRGRPRHELLALYGRIARVLHEVHELGVTHRDLKPSNVMLAEGTQPPRVVLIDFGLAVQNVELDELTGPGTIIGTPAYMSPEMLQGAAATPASDVFALAMMLFEALTGTRPWAPTANFAQSVYAILKEPPALGALAGTALGALIERMLSTDPTARPSAAEVAGVLGAQGANPLWQDQLDVFFPYGSPAPLPDVTRPVHPGRRPTTDVGHRDPRPPPPMIVRPPEPGGVHESRDRPAEASVSPALPIAGGVVLATGAALAIYLLGQRAVIALAVLLAALGLVAAAVLVRRVLARRAEQRRAHGATLSPLISRQVEERLRAIEARLEQMGQVSSSIAIEVGELRPQLDYERLERIVRESVLITVSELQVGAAANDVGKAIKALADVAHRDDDSGGPWYTRVSTWLTAGGLLVGFAGGAMGLVSSAGIWKPNTAPAIQSITAERKRATTTAPVELRVDALDADGTPLSYTYQATAGRITSNGPLALLYLDAPIKDELIRVDVSVSDGKERVSRSTTLPVNRRPALAIQAPATAAPGAAVPVTVHGTADPDGDALTYRWSASTGQLSPDSGRDAILTAPASPGTVHVRCTVSDGWDTWELDGAAVAIQ